MRRMHLLWIAPWLLFGLGACATVPLDDVSKACAEWRWIAVKQQPEAQCPKVAGWAPEPLFAVKASEGRPAAYGAQKDVENPDAPVAPARSAAGELQRFCVYERQKRLGRPPFVPSPTSGLVRFDRDCAAVSRAGDPVPAGGWKPFADQFLTQAGKPATPLEINNRLGVRLAFLDTQPTNVGIPAQSGRSEHGFTMAHIARHLVCSPEDSKRCAAQITTRLALPIFRFDPRSKRHTEYDWIRGGFLGFQSHLADAIVEEVEDWQAARSLPDAPEHLVLNISAAWDGDFFGGLDEAQIAEMRAGTQAVYRALQYAAENGVLVLAAAGNKRDCEEPSEGPMLPAAWEEGTPPDGTCGEPREPLVYAVGGVDSQGQPLSNARPGGMPKRAAFAENAVVGTLDPGMSTRMYTGSSVATAVVSSIAAIVWDTLPRKSPAGVMEILDESETALSLPANFWFRSSTSLSATAPPVHMLSLCKALERACAPGVPNCPLPAGAKCPEWTPARSRLKKDWETPAMDSCHPWTGPQPEENPCPICNPPRG